LRASPPRDRARSPPSTRALRAFVARDETFSVVRGAVLQPASVCTSCSLVDRPPIERRRLRCASSAHPSARGSGAEGDRHEVAVDRGRSEIWPRGWPRSRRSADHGSWKSPSAHGVTRRRDCDPTRTRSASRSCVGSESLGCSSCAGAPRPRAWSAFPASGSPRPSSPRAMDRRTSSMLARRGRRSSRQIETGSGPGKIGLGVSAAARLRRPTCRATAAARRAGGSATRSSS